MKVFQINTVCGVGSTGRIAAGLRRTLMERGHASRIAYGRGVVRGVEPPDALRVGGDADVYAHALLARLTDRAGFFSARATRRLIGQIEAYAPDVIQLHNLHGYYVHVGLLFDYLARAGIPVVWTMHDGWAFTGHCACFSEHGCEKWQTGCEQCPGLRSYPASLLADQSRRNWAQKKALFTAPPGLTLVSPSRWMARQTRESFLRACDTRVIPNGVDLRQFQPTQSDARARLALGNARVILGVAGLWLDRKGLPDFLRLAGMLGEDSRIVLVGLSAKQLRGLPPNVVGVARTSSVQELAEIYSAADVLFNPTYDDNFPTVNLEALACGTPVVTYQTGGSPETITDACGAVVAQGDLAAAKTAIENLRVDRQACRAQAAHYEKSAMYARYIALYEELTAGRAHV